MVGRVLREMAGLVLLLDLALSWAWGLPSSEMGDAMSMALQHGDECSSEGSGTCALNALQLAGRSGVRIADAAVSDSPTCGGVVYDISKEGCCGGKDVFTYSSQSCCAGDEVYSLTTQGCCDNSFVFSYSSGGCSASQSPAEAEDSADGSAASVPVPTLLPPASFECRHEWPTAMASFTWDKYCGLKPHKVWVMTPDCKIGSFASNYSGEEAAEARAMQRCAKKVRGRGQKCVLLDSDGALCSQSKHRDCAGKSYDVSHQGCCDGRVYDFGRQDCCGGLQVFDRGTEDCCAGEVFASAKQGCCGRHVFDTATHACCLNRGAQVYVLGKQNCCHHPSGVCTIHHGQWSCCH